MTHASVFVRARTVTGSMPTGIDPAFTGVPDAIEKTSRRPSARFTASNLFPSGVIARGETCGVSQFTNVLVPVARHGGENAALAAQAKAMVRTDNRMESSTQAGSR